MISYQMKGGNKMTMNMHETEWKAHVCEMEWVWMNKLIPENTKMKSKAVWKTISDSPLTGKYLKKD